MARTIENVGRVVGLSIYPIKSMHGEHNLQQIKLGWQGFANDRRFAFHRLDDNSGLPWLSARDFPELILYKAQVVNGGKEVVVKTPSGRVLPITSGELVDEIAKRSGHRVELMQLWRGTYDAAPLSIVTSASIGLVEAMVGRALEVERFRPNIVIDPIGKQPYPEDHWVGESLLFGEAPAAPRVRINRKDQRCRIINLSPATAEEDISVLQEVVRQRKNNVGVYATPEFTGTVSIGDLVRIIKT